MHNWIIIKDNYVKHLCLIRSHSQNVHAIVCMLEKPCNLILLLHMYHLFPPKRIPQ